jgi:hypothetical protein
MLLEHASAHVPYYGKVLESLDYSNAGSDPLLLLKQIPILTKSIIRENFESMKATNLPSSRFVKMLRVVPRAQILPFSVIKTQGYDRLWKSAAMIGWAVHSMTVN